MRLIEVSLESGLDGLTAFSDGSAYYLNHAEKVSVIESATTQIRLKLDRLLQTAQAIVAEIGPWEQPCLPPPLKGFVRMSFLVADGLYFGQGTMGAMERERRAGPLLEAGTALLQVVVANALEDRSHRPKILTTPKTSPSFKRVSS